MVQLSEVTSIYMVLMKGVDILYNPHRSDGYWFDVGPPRVNNPLVPGDRLGYFCKIPTLVLETEVVVEPTKPGRVSLDHRDYLKLGRKCHFI